ncbi:hypothetical protein Rhal01_01980 [Rubritalea halochordaticola]|uniref:PA14 domain-containing protein n=1 Tax=Rubritalea halochordaticola TaxID=714537 RepID=A0ABP9V3Z8_9BACT
MSLHAQLTPGAVQELQSSRRNSSIAAILIALLSCVLLSLVLGFILLKSSSKDVSALIAFGNPNDETIIKDPPVIRNEVVRKPSPPSSTANRFLNSLNSSNFSVPSPKINSPELSLDMGISLDDDFGRGYDNGPGTQPGSGPRLYGSPTPSYGSLTGHLYDFKQTRTGREVRDYDTANRSHFTERVNDIHRARFRESSFRKYYQAPQALHVHYIAIPFSNAADAPKFFQAEDKMKPSGWVVHYSGKVKVPESGEYRLVGSGDDYMSVSIDRKMRLVAAWPDIAPSVEVRGANAFEQPNHRGPFNIPLTYGEWFNLREGDVIDVDIAIGERPGGKVGFVLMLEKKGEEYRQAPDGRKILPPFVFGQLQPSDLDYLENFPGWRWDTHKILPFHAAD